MRPPEPSIRRRAIDLPSKAARVLIGADTGGTFTDFVFASPSRLTTWKTPSTPDDFARGVLAGLDHLLTTEEEVRGPVELVHASTVATNALLERKGARTSLITTEGFRDVLAIGRQARPELYDLRVRAVEPLVSDPLRIEVRERVSAEGEILVPLDPRDVEAALDRLVAKGAESVAVCLLFSFLHPDHERMIGERARQRGLPCSLSSTIAPEFREYERTSTTVVNAAISPLVSGYIHHLSERARAAGVERIRIVHSNGGSVGAEAAAERAVQILLSGPAAGVLGARSVARRALGPAERIITFDMGGTSTDVSLQHGPQPRTTTQARIGDLPVQIPVIDIHTVGAGGGSLARIDAGGALRVGPESAGADPGPACYGSSEAPTVTDANLVLGRIDPDHFLGGRMRLDASRSERALASLGVEMAVDMAQAARSVVAVVNASMERAIRIVSVRRGHDPREYTLVSFGGAGGLHACAIADALGMSRVLLPRNPGVLSAWGAVVSDVVREYSRTVMRALEVAVDRGAEASERDSLAFCVAVFIELARLAESEMAADGHGPDEIVDIRSADLRYAGQSYELNVPFTEDPGTLAQRFHEAHERRYGHSEIDEPLEIVTLRLKVVAHAEDIEPERVGDRGDVINATLARSEQGLVVDREALGEDALVRGPVRLIEPYATAYVPVSWSGRVDRWGHILLERERS